MTARGLLNIVKNQWLLILLSVATCVLASVVVSMLTPERFASNSTLYVSAQSGAPGVESAYQGGLLSEDRVKSYTQLITSDRIANDVVQRLRLSESPSELLSWISASSASDTVLITVTVTAPSPDLAVAIGNSASTAFVELAQEIERPSDPGRAAPVTVRVVQGATSTGSAVAPDWTLNLALGLFVGVALGLLLAVARVRIDTSVRAEKDLSGVSDSPILAQVPAREGNAVIAPDEHSGMYVEALGRLRTNLQFVDPDNPTRSIVITSALPGEGKTTTSLNLSVMLARAGFRVVLVEADLRRPSVGKYTPLQSDVGLSSVIIGRCGIEDAIQPYGLYKIDVITAGSTPPNPSELLGSQKFHSLLTTLKSKYDYVIVDAPPLLAVTDGALLASQTDGAIMVLQHGSTREAQVAESLEAIHSVNAVELGFVINRVPLRRDGGYGSYVGYSDQRQEPVVGEVAEQRDGVALASARTDTLRRPPSPGKRRESSNSRFEGGR